MLSLPGRRPNCWPSCSSWVLGRGRYSWNWSWAHWGDGACSQNQLLGKTHLVLCEVVEVQWSKMLAAHRAAVSGTRPIPCSSNKPNPCLSQCILLWKMVQGDVPGVLGTAAQHHTPLWHDDSCSDSLIHGTGQACTGHWNEWEENNPSINSIYYTL